MACPSHGALAQYASGGDDSKRRSDVGAHLDECAKCREVVALAGTQPVDPAMTPTLAATASTAPSAPTTALPANASLGRYKIESVIGAGGMGVVYRAFDAKLGRAVALKVVRPVADDAASDARARLIREARAMAKIAHPNVIVVYDTGDVDDEVFIAMELVAGANLADWEKQRTRPWREIVGTYVQAARGLAAAHRVGLVHRDFKPHNVLVGDDERVRVLDFGIARSAEDAEAPSRASRPVIARTSQLAITETGAIMGSPMYMSPEQHAGERADARSDQFSFCVALYHALYGVQPFPGKTYFELRHAVTTDDASPVPRSSPVPPAIGRALLRGLSRQRDARFPSMDELIAVVAAATRPRRTPWILGASAALVLGLGATVVALGMRAPDATGSGVAREPGFDTSQQQVTFVNSDSPTLSPDGHRLAYSADDGIVVRDLATGTRVVIEEPRAVSDLRWSPIGDRLAIATNAGLRIVTADGAPVREVHLEGDLCRAAWSPDATRLLWHCFNDDPFTLVQVETGELRSVTLPMPGAKKVFDHDWSPTGELAIAAVSRVGGEIWIADIDTLRAERIVVDKVMVDVRWGPRGTRLYYSRLASTGGEIVYRDRALPAFAYLVLTLPSMALGSRASFALTPDERSLFYSLQGTRSDIAMVSAKAPVPTFITTDEQLKTALALSPDGAEFVYAAGYLDSERVYRQRFGGGSPVPLPVPAGTYPVSTYSPRGDQLALVELAGSTHRILIVTLATGEVRELPGDDSHQLVLGALTWTTLGLVAQGENRALVFIDPVSGRSESRDLGLPPGSRLRAFTKDGARAVGVDTSGRVFTIGTREGTPHVIATAQDLGPIGFSEDGTWIYATQIPDVADARIRAVAISGAGDGAQRLLAVGREGKELLVLADESVVQIALERRNSIWVASRDGRASLPAEPVVAPPSAVAVSPHPEPTNLELAGAVGKAPDSWDATGDPQPPVIVQACGAHPSCVELDGASSGALVQRFDATPYRGRRVTLSFDARVTHSTLHVRVRSGVYTTTELAAGDLDVEDGTWARHTVIADVASDAVYVEVELAVAYTGNAWIAGLSID